MVLFGCQKEATILVDALLNLRLVKDRLIAREILLHADNGTDRNGENAEIFLLGMS